MKIQPTALKTASPLYYVEAGRGLPVVLLHGLGSDSRLWTGVRERLIRSWRVFTPDLPGHGRSPRPGGAYSLQRYATYIARWMDALELGAVRLVGYGLGAAAAIALALERPDLVRSVAAVSPVRLIHHRPSNATLRTFMAFGFAQSFGKPSPERTRRFLTYGLGVGTDAVTDDLIELWQEASIPSTLAMVKTNLHMRRPESSLYERLESVSCPVGLLWGEKDPLFPGKPQVAEIAHRIPKARLDLLETGHLPMVEAPDRFAAWLDAHLQMDD